MVHVYFEPKNISDTNCLDLHKLPFQMNSLSTQEWPEPYPVGAGM